MSFGRNTLLAAALVVLLWAWAFVAVKFALREIQPSELAFFRYLVASGVFVLMLLVRRVAIPRVSDLPRLALLGGVGIALYNVLLNHGQLTVTAGIASLLINTVPILTSLLSIAVLSERIGYRGWAGTLVSFAGVALIGLERGGWTGFDSGTLFIFGAALAQACYFVLAKPMLARYHPIDLTSYVAWFGCAFLAPFGGNLDSMLGHVDSRTIGAVVFLGVGPAALAYVAWSYVLSTIAPGRASNALFLVPVLALILGWLVLDEIASPIALLGGGLAISGLVIRRT